MYLSRNQAWSQRLAYSPWLFSELKIIMVTTFTFLIVVVVRLYLFHVAEELNGNSRNLEVTVADRFVYRFLTIYC